jgi:hypothetical protein
MVIAANGWRSVFDVQNGCRLPAIGGLEQVGKKG